MENRYNDIFNEVMGIKPQTLTAGSSKPKTYDDIFNEVMAMQDTPSATPQSVQPQSDTPEITAPEHSYQETIPTSSILGGEQKREGVFAESLDKQMQKEHLSKMSTDPAYRDDYFRGLGYQDAEDYRKRTADRLEETLKNIGNTLPESLVTPRSGIEALRTGSDDQFSRLTPQDKATLRNFDKVRNAIKTLRSNNFWSGLGEGFDLKDIATLGFAQVGDNVTALNALNKAHRGEQLNDMEKALVDAWKLGQQVEGEIALLGGRSLASNIGRGVGESLPFVTEMIATGGAAAAATKGISKAIAKKALKEGAEELLKEGSQQVAKKLSKDRIVSGLQKGGLKLAESAVGNAARVPLTGGVYKNYTGKRLDQFLSEDGEIKKYTTPAWKDALNAFREQQIEYMSEDVGQWLGVPINGLGSRFAHGKIGKFLRLDQLADYKGNAALQWVRDQAKITNLLAETLGEAGGDFANNIFNRDKDGWRQMLTKEYWWQLIGVSSILPLATSIPNVLSSGQIDYSRRVSELNKIKTNALAAIKNSDLRTQLTKAAAAPTIAQRSEILKGINWKDTAISKADGFNAVKYINATTAFDISEGEASETERLARFFPVATYLEERAYMGKDGKEATNDIIEIADNKGNAYTVQSGDIDSKDPKTVLKVQDLQGRVWDIPMSDVASIERRSIEDAVSVSYAMMFGTQAKQQSLDKLQSKISDAVAVGVSNEEVKTILENNGVTVYQPGDAVQTVNGESGTIVALDGDHYIVEVTGENGETAVRGYGINDIVQPEMTAADVAMQKAEPTAEVVATTQPAVEPIPTPEQQAIEGVIVEAERVIDEQIDNATNVADGNVYNCILEDDSEVVIRNGNIVLTENGEIDAAKSDSTIVVEYPDGRKQTISPQRIAYIASAENAQQTKENAHEQLRNVITEQERQSNINIAISNGDPVVTTDGRQGVVSATKDGTLTLTDTEGNTSAITLEDIADVAAPTEEVAETAPEAVEPEVEFNTLSDDPSLQSEKQKLISKLKSWLTPENISWAEGKDLNESIEKFGNDVEPIAILPSVLKNYFPQLTSLYLYSGKGYLIDHAANHHPELSIDDYENIQTVLDEYDDIKDLSNDKVKKIAFIKMLDKGYAVVTELSESNGRIFLHKTFFYKDSQGKRVPYRNKESLLKKAPVDGSTTISPAMDAAGRHREISALDATSENKDTTSDSEIQIPRLKNGEVDYNSIDNAELFASLLVQDLGSPEDALEAVKTSIDGYSAEYAKLNEETKKEKDITKRVAKTKESAAIARRLEVLNQVQEILSPKPEVAASEPTVSASATPEVAPTPEEVVESTDPKATYRNRIAEWVNKLGINVRVLESVEEVELSSAKTVIEQGQRVVGWYNVTTGEVCLYMPNIDSIADVDSTIVHEVVAHKGMAIMLGNDGFNALCDRVWNMMSEEARSAYINYPGVGGDTRKAADEYIAHLAERVDLDANEQTIWQEIVNFFREALAKIGFEINITDEVLADLIRASYHNLAAQRLQSQGAEVDSVKGDVLFAVKDVLTGKDREQAIADLMKVTGRSRKTVEQYLKAEESLAQIILNEDNVAFLDLQVDESVPSIWNNSDYPQGTVEFSNICRKRLPLTMIYQRLQKEFPNTVFDATTLETIRGVLKNNGIDVACGLCFVEDRRQLLGEIGQEFIDAVRGEHITTNANQIAALEALKDSGDNYVPNLYELLTLDGMKELRRDHPEVAAAFVRYNNARGMQAGRLFQAYSAYHREILDYSAAKVKSINDNGGLRIFSFSDFEAHHLIDLVQVLTDCAAKGIKVQGYTKVPEFARAVKDTKMKLNRSLIAKGSGVVDENYTPKEGEAISPNVINGKRLLLDTVEGIDVNNVDFFDSTSSSSVGNILVGINDEQIRLAMEDPFVDYIIPFHTGIKRETLIQKGIGEWVNYKNDQVEKVVDANGKLKKADKHVNIYTDVLSDKTRTERQFVNKYLKICRERGYTPKFPQFLNKNSKGEYIYTKGYYKFLLDFKMFDQKGYILPQEVIVPIFDNDLNKRILEEYVEGERTAAPNEEVYNEVKEALELDNVRFRFIGEKDIKNVILKDTEDIKLPSNRKEAFDHIPEGGRTFYNEDTDSNIKVSRKAIKHTTMHNKKEAYAIFADMESIVGNAVKIGNIPVAEDEVGHTHAVNVMYVPININGTQYSARLLVKELENKGKVLEDLSLYNISMHKENSSAVQPLNASNEVGGITAEPYSYYKVKDLIHNSQEIDKEIVGISENTRFRVTPAMDAAYLDAVKRGDMETAQRMVNEAAEAAGYTTDESWKKNHRAPRKDEENSNPFNTEIIVPADYWTHPEWYTQIRHNATDRESYYNLKSAIDKYKRLVAEGKQEEADKVTVTMYRGVDRTANKKESKFRNGDWITPSREYALLSAPYGKARVISQDVLLKDIWWDGNSINEWGYDDGSEYTYKDTKNNRKLLDAVTYDDNGNIIPLSERFNPRKEDIRYSVKSAPVFYSNAENAVRNIKQEKATPEQWLKMIEKNGGLKAGEDKWLGLSDWLRASDKKTLTKDEVLEYISQNQIQIEEVKYSEFGPGLIDEAANKLTRELQEIGIDGLREKYPDFDDYFEVDGNEVLWSENTASEGEYEDYIITNQILNVNPKDNAINERRLSYTTAGLRNKQEIALVTPNIEPWGTSDEIHFGDAGEGRAVAWVRFGETADTVGNRVLVIDEIQSKRHQEGRDRGYISKEEMAKIEAIRKQKDELSKMRRDWDYRTGQAWRQFQSGEITEQEYNRLWDTQFDIEKIHLDEIERSINTEVDVYDTFTKIPSAPFEKNWAELAMKRMLRYAAENGYDKVAWTTGDQQAERYNLGAVMTGLKAYKTYSGEYYVMPYNNGAIGEFTKEYTEKELADTFGKELATNIITNAENATEENPYEIEGENLRFGGSGMKTFYDTMLVNFMNKYGKKWGVKVGEVTMPELEENNTMHSVDVTDAMRDSVMQGQLMFSIKSTPAAAVMDQQRAEFEKLTEEYDSLLQNRDNNPNFESALNEWRDRKVKVLQSYLYAFAENLGIDQYVVIDIFNTRGVREEYSPIVDLWMPGISEEERQKALDTLSNPDSIGVFAPQNGVLIDVSHSDDSELKVYEETLVHEFSHYDDYHKKSDEDLFNLYVENEELIKKFKDLSPYVERGDSEEVLATELLSAAMGRIYRRGALAALVNGSITPEEAVDVLKYSKPLMREFLIEKLNRYKDYAEQAAERRRTTEASYVYSNQSGWNDERGVYISDGAGGRSTVEDEEFVEVDIQDLIDRGEEFEILVPENARFSIKSEGERAAIETSAIEATDRARTMWAELEAMQLPREEIAKRVKEATNVERTKNGWKYIFPKRVYGEAQPIATKTKSSLQLARERVSELYHELRNSRKSINEIIETLSKEIRGSISTELVEVMGKRDFDNIVRIIEEAVAKGDIEQALRQLEAQLLKLEESSLRNAYNKMMNLKLEGTNPRGVSVSRWVDQTARVSINTYKEALAKGMRAGELDKEFHDEWQFGKGEKFREPFAMFTAIELLQHHDDVQRYEAEIAAIDEEIAELRQQNSELFYQGRKASENGNREEAQKYYRGIKINKEIIADQLVERLGIAEKRNASMRMLTNALNETIMYGRSAFAEMRARRELEKAEIVNMGFKDCANWDKPTPGQDEEISDAKQFGRDVIEFLLSPAYSMNSALKYISINAPGGEGALYNHFVKSKRGYIAAQAQFYTEYNKVINEYSEKAKEIFGEDYDKVVSNSDADSTIKVTIINGKRTEDILLTYGEAMYLYMADKMSDGRVKIRKMGISEEDMNALIANIPQQYIQFADWIQGEFLPSLREKYNQTHLECFGIPMSEVDNYVPLKVLKSKTYQEVDGSSRDSATLPSAITGSIIKRTRNTLPIDLHTNALEVVRQHIEDMEHWNAYTFVIQDMNALLSSTEFRRMIDHLHPGMHKKLKDLAQVAAGTYSSEATAIDKGFAALNKVAATSKIAFRINTALKQVLSYPAFYAYAVDAKYWKQLTRNLSPDVWKENFEWAINNCPSFKARWESRSAGNEKLSQATMARFDKIVKKINNVGMFPNAFVDAMTCANGAKAVYDYKLEYYKERGLGDAEAERLALLDAATSLNETQQSSEGLYLSVLQSRRDFFSISLSTFQNSNFAYLRKQVEAIVELRRDRDKEIANRVKYYEEQGMESSKAEELAIKDVKDAKMKAGAELIMFSVMLNMMWTLGGKVWQYLFGDDDDREEIPMEALKAFALSPIRNTVIGSTLESIAGGYGASQALFFTDLHRSIQEIQRVAESDPKSWDQTAFWITARILVTNGVGVDLTTFANMYQGVAGMIRDGVHVEDIMNILNAPQSQAKLLAGKPKEGESLEEYQKRMAFIYKRTNDPTKKDLARWEREYIAGQQRKLLLENGYSSVDMEKSNKRYNEIRKVMGITRSGNLNEDARYEFKHHDPEEQELIRELLRNTRIINAKQKQLERMVDFNDSYLQLMLDIEDLRKEVIEKYDKSNK